MGERRVLAEPQQPQAALQGPAQVLSLVVLLPARRQGAVHVQPMRLQACTPGFTSPADRGGRQRQSPVQPA